MFFSAGGQFSCPCFLRRLSFPLLSFPVWCSWTDRIHVASLLGSLCLPRVHTSVFVQVLTVVHPLRDVVWSLRGRCVQLCSFSESFWLFDILFNISSPILGVFLFLWKMAWNIILWLQSMYLLMALVAMDILIPHCSSAWAWNSFLFLCVFFGFFISAFEFSDYWSFMSLIKFFVWCFILWCNYKWDFLNFCFWLLLVYRNTTDSCILIGIVNCSILYDCKLIRNDSVLLNVV